MAVVYACAYGATGDRALSEEIAQDTFLCAWNKMPGLDAPPQLPGWLCGIARGLARNARRRRGRERGLGEGEIERVAAGGGSALEELLEREREALVRRALERVPERYREPLVMYYQGDESVEAVAAALGLSAEAVRQRLSRGRAKLRGLVRQLAAAVAAA